MKRILAMLLVMYSVITLNIPTFCHATPVEEYEEAYKIYIAVGASVAAYNDRIGDLTKGYLENDGWKIDRYVQKQGRNGARFLVAKKEFSDGKQAYILAFVGTETKSDVDFDFKFGKVYFAGTNVEEFASNAAKKGIADTEPKVHQGFHEFVKSGLTAETVGKNGTPLLLTDILLANKDCKIYLVGHSLGGAAATLAGAGLINMGVEPRQIEVITFGAPAVGNAAFAAKFAPVLNLKRIVISGDIVTGIIQNLVGGYKQFGKEIRWTVRDASDKHHRVTEYVDLGLKNYYDKLKQALDSGIKQKEPIVTNEGTGRQVYVTPLKNNLPKALDKDFVYINQFLLQEYAESVPGCVIGNTNDGDNWRDKALASGFRWVVVPEVNVTQLRQEENIYHITVSQTIYEVASGRVLETGTFSTATYNLTPLEAVIHDIRGINNNPSSWLTRLK